MQQQYTAEERERAMRMAAEVNTMRRRGSLPMRLEVDVFDLFRAIGALQLAWRHSGLDVEQRDGIERFARQLQGAFDAADCPETARTLEQGWHREFDR